MMLGFHTNADKFRINPELKYHSQVMPSGRYAKSLILSWFSCQMVWYNWLAAEIAIRAMQKHTTVDFIKSNPDLFQLCGFNLNCPKLVTDPKSVVMYTTPKRKWWQFWIRPIRLKEGVDYEVKGASIVYPDVSILGVGIEAYYQYTCPTDCVCDYKEVL